MQRKKQRSAQAVCLSTFFDHPLDNRRMGLFLPATPMASRADRGSSLRPRAVGYAYPPMQSRDTQVMKRLVLPILAGAGAMMLVHPRAKELGCASSDSRLIAKMTQYAVEGAAAGFVEGGLAAFFARNDDDPARRSVPRSAVGAAIGSALIMAFVFAPIARLIARMRGR